MGGLGFGPIPSASKHCNLGPKFQMANIDAPFIASKHNVRYIESYNINAKVT
jgi:hypothetical protein